MSRHWTIWQCRDWCCESKPYAHRWWNASNSPGSYDSFPNWRFALAAVSRWP